MSQFPKLIYVPEVQAVCNWPTEDVAVFGHDTEGNLVVMPLTPSRARTLAEQLFRAANDAQDWEEGYEEAERKAQERDRKWLADWEAGRDYTDDVLLDDIFGPRPTSAELAAIGDAGQRGSEAGAKLKSAIFEGEGNPLAEEYDPLSDPELFNEFSGMRYIDTE